MKGGLNYRFKWIIIPNWLVYLSVALFLAAYLMYDEVLRENEYLSRVVEVQENQKVNEEVVLCQGLEGYEEYRQKLRYKVIPFIW